MATYNKPLKTISITLMSGGDAITVADTAADAKASNALAEFEAHKTMHIKNSDTEIIEIPFHAVAQITVTTTTTEVEAADPYGC